MSKIQELSESESVLKRPRHRRGLVWSPLDASFSPTARSTEYADPVPDAPDALLDSDAAQTIMRNPELFKIICPINVDKFQSLLSDHPNQPFVHSVCRALRHGFWPWAEVPDDSYPSINDNSMRTCKKSDEQLAFIESQLDEEIRLGRVSASFGKDLLPGMYSVPMHTVPKPNSDKLRLVVDHTAGDYSLNSMIESESIRGTKLDGLHSLGASLLQYREHHPNVELIMFKSDVSQAFRRLPMHPLWQVKQILTVKGERHVDRNNNFGGRGSPKVWISFMSLVAWIAIHRILIEALKTYMDDSYSFDLASNRLYYAPYKCFFPAKQTRLLQLWDDIGLPHERPKQLFGTPLTIIGFDIDPNAMTATLPVLKKDALVAHLRQFAGKGYRWTLREFQQLAGWCEWSFNVFPLLKPGLSAIYAKIRGKTDPFARLHVNNAIIAELCWMADHIDHAQGLLFYKSLDFSPTSHDVVVAYTDASGIGLGLWFPDEDFACQCPLPEFSSSDTIYFMEGLAVCSAIHAIRNMAEVPPRMLIYTDNENVVAMFNTLRAQPPYNSILISAMDVLIEHSVDLRVVHVSGHLNNVADALSRFQNERVLDFAPNAQIFDFEPPRDALGVFKK